jgi:hypothetical protein
MIVQPDNHQLRAGLANRRATEVSNYGSVDVLGPNGPFFLLKCGSQGELSYQMDHVGVPLR